MKSGINYYESPYEGSPHQRLNTSGGDWAAIALGEPMNAVPGERWQYNSGGVIALARVVQTATGARFVDYARERLFTPLGITTQYWIVSRYDSLPHTGGGLNLHATDLARIGYLVLRNGKWNARQIVSESWIRESTRLHTQSTFSLGGYGSDYGLLWWRIPATFGTTTDTMLTMSGNMNQWAFIIPRLDLVIAVTGADNRSSVPEFVVNEILPSIVRD
jgi:CubicO group peptidase (beta-lactamase class C family)